MKLHVFQKNHDDQKESLPREHGNGPKTFVFASLTCIGCWPIYGRRAFSTLQRHAFRFTGVSLIREKLMCCWRIIFVLLLTIVRLSFEEKASKVVMECAFSILWNKNIAWRKAFKSDWTSCKICECVNLKMWIKNLMRSWKKFYGLSR